MSVSTHSHDVAPNRDSLAKLPGIDRLLETDVLKGACEQFDRSLVTDAAREAVEGLRRRLLRGEEAPEDLLVYLALEAAERLGELTEASLKRVINATGVVLHTNLGRAPLPAEALNRAVEVGLGYSNLEIDLETGERGARIDHVDGLLCTLTGAEASAVVNNNAAAVLIALNTLATGREAVVSRGQLIEIGGSFRIPDVMERSGARMVEVGTTNRTHPSDFELAISEETGILLSVNPSNYRVEGFTAQVSLDELVEIGRRRDVPVLHDLGGGVLIDVEPLGLPEEPVAAESVSAGADVVTFSGDKLLGGPQCGILVGKKLAIERIRRNPLMRALRCDKLTYVLLEETLKLFLDPARLPERHPAFASLVEDVTAVRRRAQRIVKRIDADEGVYVVDSEAQVGSGSLPLVTIPSAAVAIRAPSPDAFSRCLRTGSTPVIGYVRDDTVFLDARTIRSDEVDCVADAVVEVLKTRGERV